MVDVLNNLIDTATAVGIPIFASQDWHPEGHVSFMDRGGPWPRHCVQGTEGAAIRSDLNLPGSAQIVQKGTNIEADSYSAFDGTDLAGSLADLAVTRLWVGGLALDYCVRASVLDAISSGFQVRLIRAGTRAVNVNSGDGDRALSDIVDAGAVVEPHE